MKQRPRIYYTESQKALMWERWQKGESLQQIAQLFDRNHSSIQRILAETGGISPAQRSRSRVALTLAEREEISRAVVAGHSMRSMATSLGRAPQRLQERPQVRCIAPPTADRTLVDRLPHLHLAGRQNGSRILVVGQAALIPVPRGECPHRSRYGGPRAGPG